MQNKYIQSLRNLLDSASMMTPQKKMHPKQLISINLSRSSKRQAPIKYKHSVDVIKHNIHPHQLQLLHKLFLSRCDDLQIVFNESNWEGFIEAYSKKNSNPQELNLSDFNFKDKSIPIIDEILSTYHTINLSKNLINPSSLRNLFSNNLLELKLNNCGLGNNQLEYLFIQLINTNIIYLSLSSPHLKDRNQLTKYDAITRLIKQSKTLNRLQLANMQINKNNPILEVSRKSTLKILDLSKNNDICGMSKTIISLNLSYNRISNPKFLNVEECSLQDLDISHNQVPFYSLKVFLKTSNYPNLKSLIMDNIFLNGELNALQLFMQRSVSLNKLSVANCNLSTDGFISISYGLIKNCVLEHLNISGNKFSVKVARNMKEGLQKCNLKELIMHSCELNDECGSIIFQNIKSNKYLTCINLSNNLIGSITSTIICQNLKKSFYNLKQIKLQQTFIKYDHLKQISEYVNRNNYLSKVQLKNQWKQLHNFTSKSIQIINQFQTEIQKTKNLKKQNLKLQIASDKCKINVININKAIIQEQIKKVNKQQKILQKNIYNLMDELGQLDDSNPTESLLGQKSLFNRTQSIKKI